MAEVTLKDVKKVYAGGVEAVKGVSFDVPDGHFCVMVGPSGCGKSTLLRMIAGVETISSGEVRIGERVVNEIEPSERDIAMVFQNYALYPHMRVYDNMAYGLRNRKTPKDEIDKRVREAARVDAGGDQEAAEGARHHLDLCDARPARGDDAGRHAGGDECRQGGPDRRAARGLSAPRH